MVLKGCQKLPYFSQGEDNVDAATFVASRGCCCPQVVLHKTTSAKRWADVAPEKLHLFFKSKGGRTALSLHTADEMRDERKRARSSSSAPSGFSKLFKKNVRTSYDLF